MRNEYVGNYKRELVCLSHKVIITNEMQKQMNIKKMLQKTGYHLARIP